MAAAKTALALCRAYTQADNDWLMHTQVCPDQREEVGCKTCEDLNETLSAARRALNADPAAVAVYESDALRAERRAWSREVFRPWADAQEEDYS